MLNHEHSPGHGHEHGKVEAELYSNRAGLKAVQISTTGMLLVALIQFGIAMIGGSAGLFTNALHNLSDVLTTVALWIAFVISNRAANARYTYGYHRAEDLAGIFIVLVSPATGASSAAGAAANCQALESLFLSRLRQFSRMLTCLRNFCIESVDGKRGIDNFGWLEEGFLI